LASGKVDRRRKPRHFPQVRDIDSASTPGDDHCATSETHGPELMVGVCAEQNRVRAVHISCGVDGVMVS